MAAELLIILGAILGALAVVLVFQLRKMLIEKQVNLADLDEVIKALFELQLNREFFLKLAIGTGIGIAGAFLAGNALYALIPVAGTELQIIGAGFLWGFAGNGIFTVFRMFPENLIGILKANEAIKTQRAEISGLKAQNQALISQNETLQTLNSSLNQNASNQEEERPPFPLGGNEQPLQKAVNTEQVTPLTATKSPDGTKTV